MVEAVECLFDHLGDRGFSGGGVGPRIAGADEDLRRRDRRILLDRQGADREYASEHDDEGDDHREDRPLDEKPRHGLDAHFLLPLREKVAAEPTDEGSRGAGH